VTARYVEQTVALEAETVGVHVGGRVFRTTNQHLFYVVGRGWLRAKDLLPGMELLSHDGKHTPVEEVFPTHIVERVYNLTIAADHTYFVGRRAWGFDVWAHNSYDIVPDPATGILYKVERSDVQRLGGDKSAALSEAIAKGQTFDPAAVEKAREAVRAPGQRVGNDALGGDDWIRPKGWRLPKNGSWEGTPGHSNFKPSNPAELGLQPGEFIPFRKGVPDFSKWSKGNYKSKHALTGKHALDEPRMVEALAEAMGWTESVTRQWLRNNRYVLHHAGGDAFQILDGRLHGATAWDFNGIRHMGPAFDLRN
jgi:hypothetical protein